MAKHGLVPVGTLPMDVITENTLAAKQKVILWLGGWHGRPAESVTTHNYHSLKLPQDNIEYQLPGRAGPDGSCGPCSHANKFTNVQGQWTVRFGTTRSCLSTSCIMKLHSNKQKHSTVYEKNSRKPRTKEAGYGVNDQGQWARVSSGEVSMGSKHSSREAS